MLGEALDTQADDHCGLSSPISVVSGAPPSWLRFRFLSALLSHGHEQVRNTPCQLTRFRRAPVVHDGWDQRGQLPCSMLSSCAAVAAQRNCQSMSMSNRLLAQLTSITRVHCQRHTADPFRVARCPL